MQNSDTWPANSLRQEAEALASSIATAHAGAEGKLYFLATWSSQFLVGDTEQWQLPASPSVAKSRQRMAR